MPQLTLARVFVLCSLLTALSGSASPACPNPPKFVTVLIPLDFNAHCWSSVVLQNLRDSALFVDVEAHESSGALLPIEGLRSNPLRLAAGQKVTLRLQVPDTEATEAWVRVTEPRAGRDSPSVAVSGATECTNEQAVTTVPRAVAFPTRDPWLEADSRDLEGKSILALNASSAPASLRVCYSNGTTVNLPNSDGGSREFAVCTVSRAQYLAPFSLFLIPVEREGSSKLSIRSTGQSLVLVVLKPRTVKSHAFNVDSSIVFQDVR